jgi:hypothetical protein
MNRRKLSHVIAAGILAALLVLPGPALAEARRVHDASVWKSLAKLWQHELAAALSKGRVRKEGYGIDPNGSKPAGSNLVNPTPGNGSNNGSTSGAGL